MIFSRLFIMIMIQISVCYFISAETIAGAIDGQELYKKHCAICHGNDGKGKTDLGEGLGARDFTDKSFQDSITDEEIIEQITNGTEEKMMPFKDKLTQEEMKALVPVVRAFGLK
jgi:mono/diheme cytochrome c family protein